MVSESCTTNVSGSLKVLYKSNSETALKCVNFDEVKDNNKSWCLMVHCAVRSTKCSIVDIIGHIGDGFYGSKDPTNSVKALKEEKS